MTASTLKLMLVRSEESSHWWLGPPTAGAQTRGMSSRRRSRPGASRRARISFVTASVIVGAALLFGLGVLVHGAFTSALLVDSSPTENTVRTPELGAAWDAMLLGLGICVVSAAIAVVLIVSSRGRTR